MKPPDFQYHAPETIEQVVDMLASLENNRLLAGGQSLMPMLNMRYAMPDHIIDLNRVEGLASITLHGSKLLIGAMTPLHNAASTAVRIGRTASLRCIIALTPSTS